MEKMMAGRWDTSGVPHKGWRFAGSEDLGGAENGDSGYTTCEMCGNEQIRYVHIMEHDEHDSLRVGCVCAEKMTGDYTGPRRREAALKNRAARRAKWLTRTWRTSQGGNEFLNIKGTNLGVGRQGQRWFWRIGSTFSKGSYATVNEAKLALFDEYWKRYEE